MAPKKHNAKFSGPGTEQVFVQQNARSALHKNLRSGGIHCNVWLWRQNAVNGDASTKQDYVPEKPAPWHT